MTNGITPIDNAFELLGLQQCAALMRFIYIETLAGKAVFALGFVLAMARSLKAANFRLILVYCTVFFCCVILFIIPNHTVSVDISAMEEHGYSEVTTQDILKKAGIGTLTVSPVVMVVSRSLSALRNGAMGLIDRWPQHNASFLQAPFLTARLWLQTRAKINRGISDGILKEEAVRFYQDQYFPALRFLKDSGVLPGEGVWPGAEVIVTRYSQQGVSAWQKLQTDLYEFLNREGLLEKLAQDYYLGASLKDPAVRALLSADVKINPTAYTGQSFSGLKVVTRGLKTDWLYLVNRVCLDGLPFVYGFMLWSLWVAVPFVLLFLFFSADMAWLGGYLKFLLVVKLWPVTWVLIDRVSLLVFDILNAVGGGTVVLWDMLLVPMVVLTGLLVSVGACVLVINTMLKK